MLIGSNRELVNTDHIVRRRKTLSILQSWAEVQQLEGIKESGWLDKLIAIQNVVSQFPSRDAVRLAESLHQFVFAHNEELIHMQLLKDQNRFQNSTFIKLACIIKQI